MSSSSLAPEDDQRNNGASTSVIVLSSFTSTCSDGPAVSLNGSPTVSPTTAALWASDRLPPYAPVSMYFLALSQAPPPLLRKPAMRMPVIVPTISSAATDSAPMNSPSPPKCLNRRPTMIGNSTTSAPGSTIALSAPTVTMSTHAA